jgi:hypothetical protein
MIIHSLFNANSSQESEVRTNNATEKCRLSASERFRRIKQIEGSAGSGRFKEYASKRLAEKWPTCYIEVANRTHTQNETHHHAIIYFLNTYDAADCHHCIISGIFCLSLSLRDIFFQAVEYYSG